MEFKPFCINEKENLRTAMNQLNQTAHGILFAWDNGQRLTAALTDGDIRRHLLAGGTLDDSVSAAGNPHPICARSAGQAERLLQEGEKQAELLLHTAECYYEENGSATSASERLHLHKNSLLYRMKRLYQLLGIEKDTAFVRESYVRLLLEYWNQIF